MAKTSRSNLQCSCGERSVSGNPLFWAKVIYRSSREIMREKRSQYLFFPIAVLFLSFFMAIPVITIPSNTFALQFSIYTAADYAVLSFLAVLGSFIILTHIHNFYAVREKRAGDIVMGTAGGAASLFASIFGVASCPMCVASLFGFLGFGAVGFFTNYRWLIFAAAALAATISLYLASKKRWHISMRPLSPHHEPRTQ